MVRFRFARVLEARENAPRKQWSEADSSGGSDEEELSEEAKGQRAWE